MKGGVMITSIPWRTADDPLDEHPWVLVTADDVRAIDDIGTACAARGWETFVCDGPCAGHSCPLVEGGVCPVVDRAHLVVNGLDPGRAEVEALRLALLDRHPDLPVVEPEAVLLWPGEG